ncbi:MAG: ABC transporter permease [Thermomicrobiales bacterium]
MNNAGLLLLHIRSTNRALWRNPVAALFTFVFPLVFLVLFSVLFSAQPTYVNGQPAGGATFTLASIVTVAIIGTCYTNLAIGVTAAREGGFLKRLRGTPLPAWTYLTARIIHAVVVAFIPIAIAIAYSVAVYRVTVPTRSLPALLIGLLIGAACFAALGLAVTAIAPNVNAALVVVNALIWPLLFVSNVFIPIGHYPAWLNLLTSFFPVRHLGAAVQSALVPSSSSAGFAWRDLLALGLWGMAGILVTLRFFVWEPRQQPG